MQGEDDCILHFNDFGYHLISLPSSHSNSHIDISYTIFVLILSREMFACVLKPSKVHEMVAYKIIFMHSQHSKIINHKTCSE